MRLALALALACAGVAVPEVGFAGDRPSLALMAGGAPGPDDAQLAAARGKLAGTHRLLDDVRTREVLERINRTSSAEERVRAALQRAHQRLRRFDLAAVQQALDEARVAATGLPPSAEGRALAAEVGIREAEAALVSGDLAAQQRGMSLALAVDPALKLDPAREPPTLVALCEHTRVERATAPRLPVRVATTPPGARLFVAGAWQGETPLTVELVGPGPQILWLGREGYRPRAERVQIHAGSALQLVLEPIDEVERLRPLVDAVRQTDGERRAQAALALGAALGVDAVAVLESGGDKPAVYTRAAPPQLAADHRVVEAPRPRPWYRRGWVWGTIAGAAVVVGVVAGVAGYYGTPEPVATTCCR